MHENRSLGVLLAGRRELALAHSDLLLAEGHVALQVAFGRNPASDARRLGRQRVGDHLEVLLDFDDCGVVAELPSVVGAAEHREEGAVAISLESVHYALVAANDHAQSVVVYEAAHSVIAESYYVAVLQVVPRAVLHHAGVALLRAVLRPDQVQDYVLLAVGGLVGPLQLLDFVDPLDVLADARVHAEHLFVDQRSHRHVVEDKVDLAEHRVGVVDVLAQTHRALLAEAQSAVQARVLVAAAQQEKLVGVAQLQREEQADYLQTVEAAVHVVAEEQVVEGFDVALLRGDAELLEEPQHIAEAALYTSKNLYWCAHAQEGGLRGHHLQHLVAEADDQLALYGEPGLVGPPVAQFEQGAHEYLAEALVVLHVDVDLGVQEAHRQPLRLLRELAQRHLLDGGLLLRAVGARDQNLVRNPHVLLLLRGLYGRCGLSLALEGLGGVECPLRPVVAVGVLA